MTEQWDRDPDKSASELGQWVHDHLPREMHFIDIDGVVLKNQTQAFRVIEQKQYGQQLKKSQTDIFKKFAPMIRWAIEQGLVHPQSGVFVVEVEPPFEHAIVTQFEGEFNYTLDARAFKKFVMGEIMTRADLGLEPPPALEVLPKPPKPPRPAQHVSVFRPIADKYKDGSES